MRTPSDLEKLLSIIEQTVYDAIAEPLLWTEVVKHAREAIGASASALAVRRKQDLVVVDPVAATWGEEASLEYLTYFHEQDVVTPRLTNVPRGAPFILEQLIDLQYLKRTPFFNDWANRHEVAFLAGITFDIDQEHLGALSFHRSTANSRFSELEREFIRRVAGPIRLALGQRRLTRQLHLSQGSLHRLSIGVVHLDERGRVSWRNEKAEEILRTNDGLTVKEHTLRASNEDADKALQAMIHSVMQGDTKPSGIDMVIPRGFGKSSLHVVTVPLSRQFSISTWGDYVPTAIFINDMQDDEEYDSALRHVLKLAFSLTDLQAEITCKLIEGAKYRELVTPRRNEETVRSHVKTIYAKMGVRNRAELQKLARRMVMQLRSRKAGMKRR